MKEATQPKLMPPFHSTAASGTFPAEQINDATAIKGPTNALQITEAVG
ncbi:hypothetical protein B0G75_103625 [Paraburkholderia sp. BL18I3N2]|nr:hypothetical protein B0G75_103625 [Paraburkholderia sp. BL18I3N2]